ncbi:serine/threonine-protein kinase PknK, partial [bacterium]|nr:serine/threonine-protein kinase PknK [bacterium]
MLANRYKIISELGFGGMGTVYKVSDSLNENNFYALKMLREGNFGVNRFKREFSRIAKLRHENIVQVYDFGSFNEQNTDKYFFVMELLEGKALKEIEISDLTQVYKIITKICLALSYVHSRQIIHCDLKPANIFVTNSNEIKLMDFGLAESFDFENKGKISGTIAYIPPERIKGLSLDQRSDLYSLGVIFYELLTNKNPFDTSSVFGLLRQQLNTFPQTPKIFNKNIPDKVEKIVLKLLEKEPSKRFLNALEVLQELSQVMDFSVELQEKQETNLETLTNSSAFCGRETEFALVKSEFEKNQTYFCELVGETGSGKSRFLSEVKFFAQLQDFKVVFCDASEQLNSPFSTLSVVLERFLRFFDKTKINLLSEKFGKVLGKILPAFPKVSAELSHFEEEKLLVEAVNFIFNTFEKKFLILLENFDLCDFQSL